MKRSGNKNGGRKRLIFQVFEGVVDGAAAAVGTYRAYGVAALAQALGVSSRTVYTWFDRGERGGLAGLANAAAAQVLAAVRANRQQLKEVTATLRQELAKDFLARTLRRFLTSVAGSGSALATP